MIDLAATQYDACGKAAFWEVLREGRCFHPACLSKAIAAIEQTESEIKKDASKKDPDAAQIAEALRSYLEAAKESRNPPKPIDTSATSAADYRQWFQNHPEKNAGADQND
jgi:hypothetical protein